jgi:hypothetical protein
MDPVKATIVVFITLFIVIVINIAIFVSARKNSLPRQINMFKQAASRARNPWISEDSMLEELSRLTAQFKEVDEQDPGADQ